MNSNFHILSWSSHKAKSPVKPIGGAEILAVVEDFEEGKELTQSMSTVLNTKINLIFAVDSKDLFNSLSMQRNSIDKSIRSDVNGIRYEIERKNIDKIIWIPGKKNLSDTGTKENSPLCDALQIALYDGKFPFDFSNLETASSDKLSG